MELTGEHRIAAPRQVVWEALHDPVLLKACIKGCKRLEMTAADRMVATVEAKVGPVKATFDADIAIENSVPPESYRLAGEGKGGVAGFAKGFADVSLAADGDDATVLTYRAEAKIGGKLAQLGSRLVDTTARKYATDFFDVFSARLNGGAPVTAALPGTDTAAVPEAPYGEEADDLAPTEPLAATAAEEPVLSIPAHVRPEPHGVAPAEIASATAPRGASVPQSGAAFVPASQMQLPPTVARATSPSRESTAALPPPAKAGVGNTGLVLIVLAVAAIAAGAIYVLT